MVVPAMDKICVTAMASALIRICLQALYAELQVMTVMSQNIVLVLLVLAQSTITSHRDHRVLASHKEAAVIFLTLVMAPAIVLITISQKTMFVAEPMVIHVMLQKFVQALAVLAQLTCTTLLVRTALEYQMTATAMIKTLAMPTVNALTNSSQAPQYVVKQRVTAMLLKCALVSVVVVQLIPIKMKAKLAKAPRMVEFAMELTHVMDEESAWTCIFLAQQFAVEQAAMLVTSSKCVLVPADHVRPTLIKLPTPLVLAF